MKKVAEYTEEELEKIGKKALFDHYMNSCVGVTAMRKLRSLHPEEYKKLYHEAREELIPIIIRKMEQFNRNYRAFGMKIVERRYVYAQRRKSVRERQKEVLQGAGPVKFHTAGYWTKCSCGHIAQMHGEQGRCPNKPESRYDGKWILVDDRRS